MDETIAESRYFSYLRLFEELKTGFIPDFEDD